MKHLVIAGAGEFGRELYWTVQGSRGFGIEFDIKGYVDDNPDQEKISKLQKPCFGTIDEYKIEEEDVFTCAVASPPIRETVIKKLLNKGAEFIDIIHQSSIIHGSAEYGKGLIVSPFSIIGDSSIIGDYVLLNGFCGIGHDCVIGDYTCIMSQCDITGHTEIGKKVFFGGGARTIPKAKIEDEAYIGAGSVVLRKVKNGTKVFGNPAKAI